MFQFRYVALAACLAVTIGAATGHAQAAAYDDCRNSNAFLETEKQFNACDAALKVVSDEKQKAFVRFKRAEALYWMDQFGQALADVDLAIAADPDLIPAYIRRAWTYIFLGQWGEAGRDIEEVLSRQPRNAEALFALGFINQGNDEKSFEAIRQAVEIDPDFHLARLNLAYKQYYVRGDLDAMLKEFATILSHDEAELDKVSSRSANGRRGPYPFSASVRYERAKHLIFARRNDEALPDLNWLIERYPKVALAFVMRGQVRNSHNDRIEALKDYSRAVELDPNDADARRGKGWTLLRMSRFDEAAVEADWMTDMGSRAEGDGYFLKAVIAKTRGDHEQALTEYEQAFRNDPQLLAGMQRRLVELGYLSANFGNAYSEEMRNGVRACIVDPEC